MRRVIDLGWGGPSMPVIAVSYLVVRPGDTEDDVARRLECCRQAAARNGQVIPSDYELIEDLSDGSGRRPAWRLVRNIMARLNARHIYYCGEDDSTCNSELRRRMLRRIWSPRGVQFHFLGGEIVRPTILQSTIVPSTIADAAPARITEHFRGIVL